MAALTSLSAGSLAGLSTGLCSLQSAPQSRVTVRGAQRHLVVAQTYDPKSVDVTKVRPQTDRLLVKLDDLAQASAGGVLLPSSAVKFDRYLVGQVIAAGPEAKTATVGQKVMFSDLNAYEVSLGGGNDKLCFVRDGDLMAAVQ